ncbi:hypothetical protein ILUMI_15418, partial [Ignelater luminosus]
MTFKLHTNDDVNDDAVVGIMTIGSGFSHLVQLSASLDGPCMSLRKYQATHEKMFNLWEDNAIDVVRKTAEEEKELALAAEDVSADGTQMIKRYEPKGFKIEARTFLEQLAKIEKEIQEIQTQTTHQRESGIWYLERRNRLIASTFSE